MDGRGDVRKVRVSGARGRLPYKLRSALPTRGQQHVPGMSAGGAYASLNSKQLLFPQLTALNSVMRTRLLFCRMRKSGRCGVLKMTLPATTLLTCGAKAHGLSLQWPNLFFTKERAANSDKILTSGFRKARRQQAACC